MEQKHILAYLQRRSNHLLFFFTCWALLGWYYGEVLYIAQQNSFFSTEPMLMQFVTSNRPYGYLWWLGRAVLELFHYPILGSAITAAILTLISGLTAYVFRLYGKFKLLQFLPAVIWLGHLFFQGFDLYYQAETGKILGILICILIILILQACFIRTFSKRPICAVFDSPQNSTKQWITESITLIAIPVLLIIGNEKFRPYVIPTVHMQCALQAEDWAEMKETAKECNVSARPIAAYYAIALIQTNELTESLFDIEYNYEDLYLHDRNGEKDFGTQYYEADGNLHAGLINTAYRNAMEAITMDGPSALKLKILAEAALLNNETELCNKYLKILKAMPFEGDFVDRIERMNENRDLIKYDARFNNIMQLCPMHDGFETMFREPLFLGYNIALTEGRSMNALQASLAACLYSKMLPDFLIRTEPLINSRLPKNVQDALLLEASRNSNINQIFQFDEFSKQKYQLFINLSSQYRNRREEGAKELKEQFLDFYPYYYFYGNLSAEKQEQQPKKKESGNSVN